MEYIIGEMMDSVNIRLTPNAFNVLFGSLVEDYTQRCANHPRPLMSHDFFHKIIEVVQLTATEDIRYVLNVYVISCMIWDVMSLAEAKKFIHDRIMKFDPPLDPRLTQQKKNFWIQILNEPNIGTEL